MTANSPLLPDRHPQSEMFIADIADAILKDDLATMEHPVFTLAKRPDMIPREYEHNGNTLEIKPSPRGIATVFDKDVLIFAISQLVAAQKAGRPISKTISVSPRSLLIFTNRETGGRNYQLLEEALERLQGTQIKTNIKTGGEIQTDIFSLIDKATIRRNEKTNRVEELNLTLSDWTMNAVTAQEVLTLHPSYFRLGKPLERRIYEIARKHCGQQGEWKINIPLLYKKSGSGSPLYHFRHMVKAMIETDHLPDYTMTLVDDSVLFHNRERLAEAAAAVEATSEIRLDGDTYIDARSILDGWDVYAVEAEWREWMTMGGMDAPSNPDKAFLGFCRKWAERRANSR